MDTLAATESRRMTGDEPFHIDGNALPINVLSFCTQGWEAITNSYSTSATRQSDVYVFCVLSHMYKETVDPLNLQQWRFFVVATKVLNEAVGSQKTITLSSLVRLHPIEATYENIAPAIKQALVASARGDG